MLLGALSFIGMVLIQNAPVEQYQHKYGSFWGGMILRLGLAHVYRSWWYLTILALATFNLILCTIKRIPITLRQAFGALTVDAGAAPSESPLRAVARPNTAIFEQLTTWLKLKHYRYVVKTTDSSALITARKGSSSRLGYLVIHCSILMIIIAGVINTWTGFRILHPLSIGESLKVSEIRPGADFTLRVDDFVIETTDEGKIKDYKSTVTILEREQEVLTSIIEVNHPLVYQGISFYQSSYGQEPDRIKVARLSYPLVNNTRLTVDVPFAEVFPISMLQGAIKITRFVPHFVKDLETGEVYSRSNEPQLPAIEVEWLQEGAVIDRGWLIRGMQTHSGTGMLAGFQFEAYQPCLFTGLEIANNPGMSLLLVSFGLASVGFMITFLVPHKLLRIRIMASDAYTTNLLITGSSRNNPQNLKRTIAALYQLVGVPPLMKDETDDSSV